MSHNIEVRPARAEDFAGIAAMQVASWPIEYDGIAPPERLQSLDLGRRTATLHRLRAPLVEAPREDEGFLVAVSGGQVLGEVTCGATPDEDLDRETTGEIGTLLVHPHHWRQGIGTRLVAAALDAMAGQGRNEAVLWVLEPNGRGRAFYHATGWAADGHRRAHRGGPPPLFGLDVSELRYRRSRH